ncbi:hypothetical protein [Rhizobium sp. BR 362]|uniref:hypothetical protein n=1 Tax=Rhizobium sp. BR 362 TaxID=3040670 RepID=UPI002F3FE3C3
MHWIDPNHLLPIRGKVDCLLANLAGERDGFVLIYDDGREILVQVPPHLSMELSNAIQVGDIVTVRGLKPRHADVIAAVSIEGRDGGIVLDQDPPKHKPQPEGGKMTTHTVAIYGDVRLTLFSPKGKPRGALLTDGTVLRLDVKDASRWRDVLRLGAGLRARGRAIATDEGLIVAVDEIDAGDSVFKAIAKPRTPEQQETHPRASAPIVLTPSSLS